MEQTTTKQSARKPTQRERRVGRPRLMRKRKLTSYSLDAEHRAILRAHQRNIGSRSAAAALRDLIERFKELQSAAL